MNGTIHLIDDAGIAHEVSGVAGITLIGEPPADAVMAVSASETFTFEATYTIGAPYAPPRRVRRHGEPDQRNKPHGPEPTRRKGRQ